MKNISAKLQETSYKILKWTCRAEDAMTCEQGRKCLRKVAKHSLKLAKLQGELYTKNNREEN